MKLSPCTIHFMLLIWKNLKRERERESFKKMFIKQSFCWWFFYINSNRLGCFLKSSLPNSRKQTTKQLWQISFLKVRRIYSCSFYNCFWANKHGSAWLSPNQYGKNVLFAGRIFIGARVTKFAHKLQSTQIGHNFSCRTSSEIIAWVPATIYR